MRRAKRAEPYPFSMISVVIPAYNEERLIGKCLDAFASQRTRHDFEIIVVDNHSTDRTADIVRSYASRLPVRVVWEPRKGRGRARATGCAAARGDIIASTDADAIVPSDWIERIATEMAARPGAVALVGASVIDDCDRATNFLYNHGLPVVLKGAWIMGRHGWLNGYSCAIRAGAYRASGGFDANLNAGEDTELSIRLSRLGSIKLVHALDVRFSGRRFRRGIVRGAWEYAKMFRDTISRPDRVYLDDVR